MLNCIPDSRFAIHLATLIACSALLFGCASEQKVEPTKPSAETTKAKPAPAPPAKTPTVLLVKSADGLVEGEIIGTPAPGSKFAQLKIGMTLKQVEKLIGRPNDSDSRFTGKQFQPFYFGGDTRRMEAFYKYEGQLTFCNLHQNSEADTLIRIMVNPNATGTR